MRKAGNVRLLFEDYETVEREYYKRTKIFPIMHTIVIRREVYEKNPWVAQSLYKAFVLAQREVYEDLYETAALKFMLPWLIRHAEDTRALMGKDFWPYGIEPNAAWAEHVPALLLRAGPCQAPADASGTVRAGSAGIIQDLSAKFQI